MLKLDAELEIDRQRVVRDAASRKACIARDTIYPSLYQVLKCIHQEMIYPAVAQLRLSIYTVLPYKVPS